MARIRRRYHRLAGPGARDGEPGRAGADGRPRARQLPRPHATRAHRPTKARAKLCYKEQRELDALPGRIEALETEQTELNTLLADGAIFQSDPKRAAEAAKRVGELDELIFAAMEQWEALASR